MRPNIFRFPKHSTPQLNGRVNPSISPTRGSGRTKRTTKKSSTPTMMIESWQEPRTAPPTRGATHQAIRWGNRPITFLSCQFIFPSAAQGATISFYFIFLFVFKTPKCVSKTTHSSRGKWYGGKPKSFNLISLTINLQSCHLGVPKAELPVFTFIRRG